MQPRRATSFLAALSFLAGLVFFAIPAVAQEPILDFGELQGGKVYPTSVAAVNRSCPGKRHLEVSVEGAPWFRVTGPTELTARPGESKTTPASVDLRRLDPGVHTGRVVIRCTDCPARCRQDREVVSLRVRVVAPQPATGPAGDCIELAELVRAAEERSRRAHEAAEEALSSLDDLVAELAAAQADLDDATARREDLERFFDDSSWIGGPDGPRITRGDMELLREARRDVYDAWKNGEIDARQAEETWSEIDPDELDDLRESKRRGLDDATEAQGDAREAVEEAEDRLAEARADHRRVEAAADRAAEKAEELRRLYGARCPDRPTVAIPPEAEDSPEGGPGDIGDGPPDDVDGTPDPCPEILQQIEALEAELSELRTRNVVAAQGAHRAFWGVPTRASRGYKGEIETYEVSKAQVAGQNRAAEALLDYASFAASAGGALATGIIKGAARGFAEATAQAAAGEVHSWGLETFGDYLEEHATADQRSTAWRAYHRFMERAMQTNGFLVAAQRVDDEIARLGEAGRSQECPVPERPCLRFYRYGFQQFGTGWVTVEDERPDGVQTRPITHVRRPDGQGPFLYQGQLGECRPVATFWYRMFHFRWDFDRESECGDGSAYPDEPHCVNTRYPWLPPAIH